MKILLSFILLLFAYSELLGQSLYPILIESHKHMNVYNYNSKTNMEEEIDISIKLKNATKNKFRIISDALLSADFKFNQVNDTLLIATSFFDWIVEGLPTTIFATSSESVKILEECDSISGVYNEIMLPRRNPENHSVTTSHANADVFRVFALSKYSGQYTENFFPMIYQDQADIFREFYLRETSGRYPEDYYSMMYHGNVDAFKKYYMNNMGRASGVWDSVLRVVIKDGKVVLPTLNWIY